MQRKKNMGAGAGTPSKRLSKRKTLRKYSYEKQYLGAGGTKNRDPKRQPFPPRH